MSANRSTDGQGGGGPKKRPGSGEEELRSLRIEGRVQGVGFRWWTVQRAVALGVRGWVRNLSDGAVEAQLAGPPDIVREMVALLKEGPPGAHVEVVTEKEGAADLPSGGFEIRG